MADGHHDPDASADSPTEDPAPDGGVDVSEQAWGSDFVADMLKAYGFEYVTFNPGASFRGMEESIINYNGNDPQVIETPNECLSVTIAHGYAKATGRPGLAILHDVVGTMNAAMGIYNAYIDHAPVVLMSGTGPMRKSQRRPWIDWIHTANVQGNVVRDYVKWDDQPANVDGMAESFVRAYEISQTKPMGPTYLTLDHDIQEQELDEPITPPTPEAFPRPSRMAADPAMIARAADALVAAEMPVVLVDQLGDTPEPVDALVDLAERLGAPVVEVSWRRFNFPNTHPMALTGTDVYAEADVVLALDTWDVDWVTGDWSTSLADAIGDEFTFIEIGTHELGASGLFPNTYSVHQVDLPIMADTALAVPALRDAVVERLDADSTARERASDRFDALAERHDQVRADWQATAEERWDETPISPERMAGAVWEVIADEQWVLVDDMFPDSAYQLWAFDEYDQYIGGTSGGGAVGYGIGASIGAALAYQGTDRVPVNLQSDGDLMQFLGGLWTLGHYEIPLLSVMHNNGSMHNSTNHRMQLAEHRGRDASHESALIGTGYWDPTPDYAAIAEGMGVNGYGPVEDPEDLAPTIQAAWEDVQAGQPALVDVVCQSR